jgi:hypothetical protein
MLVTAGAGMWRWAFRGGVSREAYRGMVAAGVDWLLQSGASRPQALNAGTVVSRGAAIPFRWLRPERPESTVVEFAGGGRVDTLTLTYDDRGAATVRFEPGVYRWRAPAVDGAAGIVVVEPYSPEYVPRASANLATAPAGAVSAVVDVFLRGRWWPALLAMAALAGEWAWRRRRGLP